MRRAFVYLACFLSLSGVAEGVDQWVSIGPAGTNDLVAVAVSLPPSIYVATSSSGVLKSDDGGGTWTPVNSGLTNLSVRALVALTAFSPGFCPAPVCGSAIPVLFAATSGGGVFLGDGKRWTPVNNGLGNLSVSALGVVSTGSPVDGPRFTIYAGTDGGVFRSDDSGAHWVAASDGLPASTRIAAMAVDPSTPLTAYAAGLGGGLFKTTDGGATWVRLLGYLDDLIQSSAIAIDPTNPSTVYMVALVACPSPCAIPPPVPSVWKSSDAGATWQSLTTPVLPNCLATQVSSAGSPVLYAGGQGAVASSADGGTSWDLSQAGLPKYLWVRSLATSPGGVTVYAGIQGPGVFASGCVSRTDALCVNGERFRVELSWTTAGGDAQAATAYPITTNTGGFWFFDPANLELVVKVLDGRSVNGKWWVFYGSLTNVEFTLTVTDTLTGQVRTYHNPQGQLASAADTGAF